MRTRSRPASNEGRGPPDLRRRRTSPTGCSSGACKAYRHWLDDGGAALGRTSTTRPSTTRRSPITPRPRRSEQPEEPRRGRSGAAEDLREARHPAARARAAGRRRGGRGVRQRLGRDDVQGEARGDGHHLLLVLRGGPRAPRAGPEVPRLGRARTPTTSSRRSTPRSSATARSCYIPKGVRCPMELSTYFRINAQNTGQFERTLIVAEEGAYVSYLEGCTAPMRDENQLHAAVVELVALDDASIKYSTVQNWYPGDKDGKGGIYNFVTKRGKCAGRRSKISWTQVETGSAITWKYPSCILQGDDSVGEFYSVALTNHRQQADTGTKMIHIGKNTKSTIVSKGISAGHGQNTYRGQVKVLKGATGARNFSQCDSMLLGDHCGAHTFPYIDVGQPDRHRRARGVDLEDRRGPDLLLPAARHLEGRRRSHDRQRLLQGGLPRASHGVRRRGAEAPGRQPRGQRRLGFEPRPVFAFAPRARARRSSHRIHRGERSCWSSRICTRRWRTRHPPRSESHRPARRGPRHHGTERVGQEHAGPGAGRPRELRGHRRRSPARGRRPAGHGPGRARPRGGLPRVPVSGGDPGRQQRLLPQGRAQRRPQAPRAARARRDGLHGPGPREDASSSRWTSRS